MRKCRFKIRLLPVIAFTAIVLLLLKAYGYTLDIGHMDNVPISGDTKLWDIFCHVKASAILIITICAALIMGYLLITGQMKLKKNIIYIPMAIYIVFVLISYLLSDYRQVAWMGGIGRFEGTRVIVCYIFMLFYTINVVDDIMDVIIIVASMFCGIFVACVIGLTQFWGHDILGTEVSRMLIAGEEMIETNFMPGQVYQTVYNMNYVGMYLALIIPILLLAIYMSYKIYKDHKFAQYHISGNQLTAIIIISFTLLIVIALNVYGANSLGGVLGIGASLMMLIILNLKTKWKSVMLFQISVIGFLGILAIVYFKGTDERKCIDYFITGMDYITTSVDGKEITAYFIRNDNSYEIRDCDGNLLSLSESKRRKKFYQPNDRRYGEKLAFGFRNEAGEHVIEIDADEEEFVFRLDEEKGALYRNPFGNEVSLRKVPAIGFKGHLSAGSGRAYIWSRTLPLLKNYLLIGSGADTFFMIFPHDDYAGKYSSTTLLNIIFDKPHSMYFQMIQGTGGVSLIAFLGIIGIYIGQVINSNKKEKQLISNAIAAGVIGFLIAGIFNDSSVCTMPMFYGMLGMGTGIIDTNRY